MRVKYMVHGSIKDVSTVVDTARTESRFLSDTPNVADFSWRALDSETLEANILMDCMKDLVEVCRKSA